MSTVFSFLGSRKKAVDLSGYMRRICDLTVPDWRNAVDDVRKEPRYSRTLPVLVCPWIANRPSVDAAIFAVTKEVSDRGVSILSCAPMEGEFVVAFSLPAASGSDPWFFLGTAKRSTAVGGGFWATGIELLEFANATRLRELQTLVPLARELQP